MVVILFLELSASSVIFNYFAGCSKCMKTFPRLTEGNKARGNFSGFDKATWEPRTGNDHKAAAAQTKLAKSDAERKSLEKFGGRWSELFRLDYFNPIDGHAIDPMHCIFLGISKTMTKHYMKSGVIARQNIPKIQQTVNSMRCPSSIGRIPNKIASGFASMTSDQFKNWTLVFSPLALKDILPEADLRIWNTFVRATSLITKKIVRLTDVDIADQLFINFCKATQRHYGEQFITPNFHMTCHLCDVIKLYGPVYSFWCYSFER